MSWNYRVVKTEDSLVIYDVYYDSEGRPIGRHLNPSYLYGNIVEDLKEHLQLMMEALDKPILLDSEIGSGDTEPA